MAAISLVESGNGRISGGQTSAAKLLGTGLDVAITRDVPVWDYT